MEIIEVPQFRTSIEIPVRNFEEVVEVQLDELPPSSDIIEILRDEQSPLNLWYQFAIEYYRQQRFDEFESIAVEATKFDPSSFDAEETKVFIALLNALAGYSLHQTIQEKRDETRRVDLLVRAASLLNRAQYLDLHDQYTWLIKSIFHLRKQDWDAALDHSATLLSKCEHSLAMLASAIAHFNKGDFSRALRAFKRVISLTYESVSPFVYLGLAYSYFKLQHYSKAKLAFSRVLELHPDSPAALSGLALCEFHLDHSPQSIAKGMQLLKQAYEIEATSSLVLCHLASHFFYRRDYQKAQALATSAIQHADTPGARADACFELARIFHVQNLFDAAHTHYSHAVHASPRHLPALFGLGQVNLSLDNAKVARQCFEQVLTDAPHHKESMAVLAHLYKSESDNALREKAIEFLQQLLKDTKEGDESRTLYLLDFAEACEIHHVDKALKAYLEAACHFSSVALLNNIAVLYERLHQYPESLSYYQQALEKMTADENPNDQLDEATQALKITLLFNKGCLLEKMGKDGEAEEMYVGLTEWVPSYADANLRLGLLREKRGDLEGALVCYHSATAYSDHAWLLLGHAQLAKRDYKQALQSYEKTTDAYGTLCRANTHANMGKHASHPEVQEKELKKALDLYSTLLAQNAHHVYAVNGIGCVLAQRKDFSEAKDMFMMVKESSQQLDAWLNLAHTYVEMDQFSNALRLYDLCVKRCTDKNMLTTIYLYSARACYLLGKETRDCESLRKARAHLEQVMTARPEDQSLTFNMALVLEEEGVAVLKRDKHTRTLEDLEGAISHLMRALALFKELASVGSSQQYDRKTASQRVKYCESLLQSAQKHLEAQQEEAKAKEAKIERIKAARKMDA